MKDGNKRECLIKINHANWANRLEDMAVEKLYNGCLGTSYETGC